MTEDREAMREKLRLKGRHVVPVTKDTFPLNTPVVVEAIIDRRSGWEFDAPMHIMRPFHRYCIVSSICEQTIEDAIEDILIDLDCDIEAGACSDAWPYTGEYLKRVFRKIQKGQRLDRFSYFRSTVIVTSWVDEAAGIDCVQYTVSTEKVVAAPSGEQEQSQ